MGTLLGALAILRILLGALVILGGVVFAIWLAVWVMFYGGIVAAIDGWGHADAHAVARGILRVVFCELGILPGGFIAYFGSLLLWKNKE